MFTNDIMIIFNCSIAKYISTKIPKNIVKQTFTTILLFCLTLPNRKSARYLIFSNNFYCGNTTYNNNN
jgi:hypothetical protein